MKKNLLFLAFLWLGFAALSQAPQGISYQTVVRDGDGQPLANTAITLRMTIWNAPTGGTALYRETHTKTTNAYGLVSLFIGQGTPVIGSFSEVVWGKTACYLETAVDLNSSGQYQVLGITQFVSVPYSLYSGQAGGILSMTNQERNALQNPPVGMQIYNLTTNCLNYYNGYDWYETCGSLIVNQPPDMPFAMTPPDGATGIVFDFNLEWICGDPENDPMLFELYFGNSNPPPFFQSGIDTTVYFVSQLDFGMPYFWKIVAFDDHGNMTEGPVWSFQTMMCNPPTPWAGSDATICEGSAYQIEGATGGPEIYNMMWTTNGDGTFSDANIANPIYTPGTSDIVNGIVELTITSYANQPCPPFPGSDFMVLYIQPDPVVYAGPDQTICFGDIVYAMDAWAEFTYDVYWTTSGTGVFTNPNTVQPFYYPSADDYSIGSLDLAMTGSPMAPCMVNAFDVLHVEFAPEIVANAGPDQIGLSGVTTTLAGNQPPAGGYGQWSIMSGTGGVVAEPNNPTSTFTGAAGITYTLWWQIYSAEGCSDWDEVLINFGCYPQVTANAGPDQTVCRGEVVQLYGEAENYSSSSWFTPDGIGSFENWMQLSTLYYPIPYDYAQGCIHLVLDAFPIAPCTVYASDTMQLCFYDEVYANAGPDQLNHTGTSTTLAGNTPPAGGYGQWIIQSGAGGSIAQPNNPTSTFTGVAGNTYLLMWIVYDQYGCSAYDQVTISFATGFVCGTSTVTDVDGNVYNTVQVGSQCWMKQNLKTTKYRNGTAITYPGSNNTNWQNNTTGAYAWYNNDIANKTTYGALYNWYAVTNTNNLCPTGWHVPTDAQWTALTDYVSSQSSYRCNTTATYIAKALAAKTNWSTSSNTCAVGNNLNANNATNFTALPGGYRNADGSFNNVSSNGNWWSSSQGGASYAWSRRLTYNLAQVNYDYNNRSYGFSVRCLKD